MKEKCGIPFLYVLDNGGGLAKLAHSARRARPGNATECVTMKRIGLALVLVALAGLPGCDAPRTSGQAQAAGSARPAAPIELVAQRRPPIPDLPVPIGFELAQKESRSIATGGTRWVVHYYTGRADKWAVGRFYRREMPIHGWVQETERMIQGKLYLDFRKDRERSVIQVTDGRWSGTEIRMETFPVGTVEVPLDR